MKKPEAVLLGPCCGEMGWESMRFAPILPFLKLKKYKNRDITFIVLTREDRFDLYGQYAHALVPLKIKGDYIDCLPNCFRLEGLTNNSFKSIVDSFFERYNEKFKIIEHIYPKIDGNNFLNKKQFSNKQMIFEFLPRKENQELFNQYVPKNKPLVVIAPRYRNHSNHLRYKSITRRNWSHWNEFFDVLSNHEVLMKNFNFILCGKPGEYIPDEKDRFYDINKITLGDHSSLAGLLIVALQHAKLTVASQSAIPNISLLIGTEVLEWGHQRRLHEVIYNIKKTKIQFLEDHKYDIPVKTVMKNLIIQLNMKKEK